VSGAAPAQARTSGAATRTTTADVLSTVGTAAARLRIGLGDKTPDLARRAATETFTAGSLDAHCLGFARGRIQLS